MLDVGQGDGMILRFPNGINCLVEGGSSDGSGVGQYRLEAGLKSLGISGVDYVFISHGDQDHNSGVLEMLERKERSVRIKTLVLPCRSVWDENLQALAEAAWENGARVATMEAGEMLEQGEVRLTCLQPGEGDLLVPGNAASMVLALNYRDFDLLLTGDVEADGESLLEERLESVAHGTSYDVLKVAHHGSRNSSGELFLEKVSPRCALISAGKGNLYGHPHEETLERLGAAGCKVYNTQTDGAITIQTDGQRMYVRTMIQERKSAKTE